MKRNLREWLKTKSQQRDEALSRRVFSVLVKARLQSGNYVIQAPWGTENISNVPAVDGASYGAGDRAPCVFIDREHGRGDWQSPLLLGQNDAVSHAPSAAGWPNFGCTEGQTMAVGLGAPTLTDTLLYAIEDTTDYTELRASTTTLYTISTVGSAPITATVHAVDMSTGNETPIATIEPYSTTTDVAIDNLNLYAVLAGASVFWSTFYNNYINSEATEFFSTSTVVGGVVGVALKSPYTAWTHNLEVNSLPVQAPLPLGDLVYQVVSAQPIDDTEFVL